MIRTNIISGDYDFEENEDKIIVSFEKQKMEIPFNFKETGNRALHGLIQNLQERVSVLEIELKKERLLASAYIERSISDESAKKEIIEYLQKNKKVGVKKVSMIDLVTDLNIPTEQIEKIMDGLEGTDLD